MTSVMIDRLPSGRDVTVSIETDVEEVRSGEYYVPDDWTWTDPAGHRHTASLKTTHWVTLYTYWCCDCEDEHEESQLQCKKCGVEVKPVRHWREVVSRFRGLTSGTARVRDGWITTVYRLTPDMIADFRGVTDEWVDAVVKADIVIEASVETGVRA